MVFWFGLDELVFRTAQLSYVFSFGILNSIMIFLVMVQNQIWQKMNYRFNGFNVEFSRSRVSNRSGRSDRYD